NTGGSLITTVPTAAERNGDLTALLGAYICADGSTSAGPCSNPFMVQTTEGTTVAARAGMVFDPNSGSLDGSGRKAISTGGQVNVLTPAAPMQKLLGFLPAPNFGGAGAISSNYAASLAEIFNTDAYDGRIDYNVSEKHHFFGRYSIADFSKQSPGAYGDIAGGPSAFFFA